MDNMIGQRIKERRKELKITQKQIKEATGISTGNLSEIENGHILPSSAALINLSRILNCSTDYILMGNSRISNTQEISDMRTRIENDLIRYFRGITEDDQEDILMMAQMKYNRSQKAREKAATSSRSGQNETFETA